MIPKFSFDNLLTIEPTDAAGASDFLPFGYAGRAGRLRLRHLVLPRDRGRAARGRGVARPEEGHAARDHRRDDVPARAAALILFTAPGGAGSDTILDSDNPLPLALREAYGGDTVLADFVNYVGLAGLVASFFSIIFAYSRQLFALSRAGYLPRWLSRTGARKTPYLALVVPGLIGFLLAAITEDGALLINIAVFGATVSYVLMMVSHIVLRKREPDLHRPYRTPGGIVTTSVALVLAAAAVVATFFVDEKAAGITALIFVAALAYFWFYSRHHLVASAPEEEFAAIGRAEAELAGG
jgi:ethanolamine permease